MGDELTAWGVREAVEHGSLGTSARFIGRLGDDAVGEALVRDLAMAGVDTRGPETLTLGVQRQGRTGTIVPLVDPSGERTMFPNRAAAAQLTDVPDSWISGGEAIHISAYSLAGPSWPVLRQASDIAHAAGAILTIDASSVALIDSVGPAAFRALIRTLQPTYVFANGIEADIGSYESSLLLVWRLWSRTAWNPLRFISTATGQQPSRPVDEVLDTTGAGDAFAAGFLSAVLDKAEAVEAVKAGHNLARVLTEPGATLTMTTNERELFVTDNAKVQTVRPILSGDVAQALAEGRAVVALESTIFSTLGLPAPANADALELCKQAVLDHGATPAVTAILDGRPHVGLSSDEEKRVLQGTRKVAERDLSVAQAQGWDVGVTTVSATVALSDAAGISVFATGGIGGVHRGSELSGDVSADLDALANHPVITVCAGAKAFLDLPRTLEYLETVGVPVLGWQHDWFPAFYTRSSGLPVPHRVDDERVVCDVLRFRARPATGVLLTVPIPVDDEIPESRINAVLTAALDSSARAGITGPAVTPYVLERIEKETDGQSVPANLALARNNADIAARVAVAYASAAV
jgi:pseudouridylate synthase